MKRQDKEAEEDIYDDIPEDNKEWSSILSSISEAWNTDIGGDFQNSKPCKFELENKTKLLAGNVTTVLLNLKKKSNVDSTKLSWKGSLVSVGKMLRKDSRNQTSLLQRNRRLKVNSSMSFSTNYKICFFSGGWQMSHVNFTYHVLLLLLLFGFAIMK